MESTPQTQKLLEIVATLRKKCPWDRKQTHRTLLPYLLEEAYETVEAIRDGDLKSLREELGDLLLQIVLHSEIAAEKGAFTFEEVAKDIGDKMVRRHPHVWGDEASGSTKNHKARWTEMKQKERPRKSLFEGTPKSMPALQLSQRYGEIAASVGFDWKDVEGVWKKVQEEMKELRVEMKAKTPNKKRVASELGDVLDALSNLARHMKINAEVAARDSAFKFAKRFSKIEKEMLKADRKLSSLSPKEWDAAWNRAKKS